MSERRSPAPAGVPAAPAVGGSRSFAEMEQLARESAGRADPEPMPPAPMPLPLPGPAGRPEEEVTDHV